MEISVRGKHVEITTALRDYVEKKVGKLERYTDAPVNAQVRLNVEHGQHIVEVTAAVNGQLLRGEEGTTDMYASIDLVTDKLEKQMLKYKARLRKRGKDIGLVEEPTLHAKNEDQNGKLVRSKRFPAKPLSLEEAMVQIEMLSHDFFVFTNEVSNRTNVLYRRKDGNYGLLEPDM
jgi:putative sigma-54 modulation protein